MNKIKIQYLLTLLFTSLCCMQNPQGRLSDMPPRDMQEFPKRKDLLDYLLPKQRTMRCLGLSLGQDQEYYFGAQDKHDLRDKALELYWQQLIDFCAPWGFLLCTTLLCYSKVSSYAILLQLQFALLHDLFTVISILYHGRSKKTVFIEALFFIYIIYKYYILNCIINCIISMILCTIIIIAINNVKLDSNDTFLRWYIIIFGLDTIIINISLKNKLNDCDIPQITKKYEINFIKSIFDHYKSHLIKGLSDDGQDTVSIAYNLIHIDYWQNIMHTMILMFLLSITYSILSYIIFYIFFNNLILIQLTSCLYRYPLIYFVSFLITILYQAYTYRFKEMATGITLCFNLILYFYYMSFYMIIWNIFILISSCFMMSWLFPYEDVGKFIQFSARLYFIFCAKTFGIKRAIDDHFLKRCGEVLQSDDLKIIDDKIAGMIDEKMNIINQNSFDDQCPHLISNVFELV